MDHLAVSRRAVTRGLATLPAIAVPAVAVANSRAGVEGEMAMNMHSTITPALSNSAWEKALARYEAAKAANDEYDIRVMGPLYSEIGRRCNRPELTISIQRANGETHTEHVIPRFFDSYCDNPLYATKARKLREAWDQYCAELRQAERELGWDEIYAHHEKLVDDLCESQETLLRTPAPDFRIFAAKVAYMYEHDMIMHNTVAPVIAEEAERLAGHRLTSD